MCGPASEPFFIPSLYQYQALHRDSRTKLTLPLHISSPILYYPSLHPQSLNPNSPKILFVQYRRLVGRDLAHFLHFPNFHMPGILQTARNRSIIIDYLFMSTPRNPTDELLRKELRERNVVWMPKPFSRGMKPYNPVPLQLPACAIGILTITFTDDRVEFGCAALIARNVLITAASNLFDRANNVQATRVSFTASTLEGGIYHGTKWYFPAEYKATTDYEFYNVAVIELNASVHHKLGFLGVNFTNPKHANGCLFGYRKSGQRLTYLEGLPLQSIGPSPLATVEFDLTEGSEFSIGTPLLVLSKQQQPEVVGVYLGEGKCLRLTNAQLVKLKERLATVPEDQLTLWNKQHPKDIVKRLVESEDKWQNRIFMLGIFFEEYGPGCPRILERVDWVTLRNLNLFGCQLVDSDLYDLARGVFPVLDKLYLGDNRFGNEGVCALTRGSWADLCELYLWGSELNISVLYHIGRDLPQIRIFEVAEGKHGMPELFKWKIKVLYNREVAIKV